MQSIVGFPPAAASADVSRLMDGYLITQLLYAAAKLGVGDALARGPQTPLALAQSLGADGDALRRMLRGLAAEGLLDERPDGAFALTDAGGRLRSDTADSLCGAIIARAELYYAAAAGFLACVRQGGAMFETVHGERFFDYVAKDPARSALFQGSMADRARHEAAAVLAAYDFGPFRRLIDVGGGEGIVLGAILKAAPRLRAVLMDQAAAIARAEPRLRSLGLAERCEFVAGDLFAALPAGGDAYLLSRVLHNWSDDEAIAILANCRSAMSDDGTLLLVEMVLPERAEANPAAIRMDLHMLALFGGRERSEAEYRRLLEAAGFRLRRNVPTRSPAGISVLEAAPANAG